MAEAVGKPSSERASLASRHRHDRVVWPRSTVKLSARHRTFTENRPCQCYCAKLDSVRGTVGRERLGVSHLFLILQRNIAPVGHQSIIRKAGFVPIDPDASGERRNATQADRPILVSYYGRRTGCRVMIGAVCAVPFAARSAIDSMPLPYFHQ